MVNYNNRPKTLRDKCVMLPKAPFEGSSLKLARDHWTTFEKYLGFKEI